LNIKQLCLAVLHVGDASGYEIRKALADDLASFQEVSFGALYPALRKLVEEGLATSRTVSQTGVPDKKVYEITELGRSQFIKTLSDAPATHQVRSTFIMQLLFAEELGPERLRDIMLERLTEFENELEKVAAFAASDCFSLETRERVSRFCCGALSAHCQTLRNEIAELESPNDTPNNRTSGPVQCAG